MVTFIDTSAFLAVLNSDDEYHLPAKKFWIKSIETDISLITTNYVLVETAALLQARIGLEALEVFHDDVVPLVSIHWIDEAMHNVSMAALLTARRRQLSLVDCASFECMRRRGIRRAFTLDTHFREQGFQCFPDEAPSS
ncbi:MAG: VapC toxin family PIN domain ribonuclease [Spirochaetae bacterium HGW-Spirochaetae-1]|jgi:predicted nucleic acid-binding protein|nr:MAG: VapC toxin family PIN domain ribonuclease [Spirochaetae bacterium HGW-Spirochaetae-1]